MSALWLMAFADRPSANEGALEISRFWCMLFNQRARVLRLRRTGPPLAYNVAALLPSYYTPFSRHRDQPNLRSSLAGPTGSSICASTGTSRCRLQDSRPEWSRCLLFCRAPASPTTYRLIPALGRMVGNSDITKNYIIPSCRRLARPVAASVPLGS